MVRRFLCQLETSADAGLLRSACSATPPPIALLRSRRRYRFAFASLSSSVELISRPQGKVPVRITGGSMDIVGLLITLAIGAAAGWLAGLLVEGAGFGLLWNILIGIAGAFVAAWLFPRLGLGLTLGGGIVGAIVAATLGAVVLLLVVNLIQRLVS